MCILRLFYCGVFPEFNKLTYLARFCPSNKIPLSEIPDTHKFLHIEVLHRAARCYKAHTWHMGGTTCPGWVEGEEEMLLTQMADEGVNILKAFDKAFEYDHDNCWIKEKVWKRGMSFAEVIHQVKMTLTGKKIKRRFKVDERLGWTKPWINETSLAEQEQNTPNYDIVQEVYDQKHLAVLDQESSKACAKF
ncbi:uncharacterized protein EAF02_002570 [Botrytis sinoallii]|uniref:uncharacterized protein n=1 Tax=Botrytis sinoallii TaxID=1463999 RepID=UPI0019007784|nr:uncharacterized protein EAF02_002570 [Botrytis sinoallii]KAF7888029.1 hypothetical protein EAF02_002570 [Botrytis sinoallii]